MSSRTGDRRVFFGDSFGALMAAARSGSPWAWERLYAQLAPAVVGYLRVQGARDADDLASEVWLAVFRGIATFEGGEAQFRSWVFVIAHRRLIDERRRADRRPGSAEHHEARVVGAAEDQALRDLTDETVAVVLSHLPPAQRDVLLLRIVAGLTIEEVARTLRRSEGSVKALQRRGFATLRRKFSVEGVPL